jgi:hypothetical protein
MTTSKSRDPWCDRADTRCAPTSLAFVSALRLSICSVLGSEPGWEVGCDLADSGLSSGFANGLATNCFRATSSVFARSGETATSSEEIGRAVVGASYQQGLEDGLDARLLECPIAGGQIA